MTIPQPLHKPAFNITRASHVVLQVRDLAASRASYVDTLGFVVSDAGANTLWLRELKDGCHHSLVLTAMGFRLSEYVVKDRSEDLALVFLQRRRNPHDIVFADAPATKLHHMAYTVPEVLNLMLAAEHCVRNGLHKHVEFGPSRHFSPELAHFLYLRDPDGHRIELLPSHYQTIDIEDEPVRWQFSEFLVGGCMEPPASWLEEASTFAA